MLVATKISKVRLNPRFYAIIKLTLSWGRPADTAATVMAKSVNFILKIFVFEFLRVWAPLPT